MSNATRQPRFQLVTRRGISRSILSLAILAPILCHPGWIVAAEVETLPEGLKVVAMEAYPAASSEESVGDSAP